MFGCRDSPSACFLDKPVVRDSDYGHSPTHLRLDLPSGNFPFGFPIKTLYAPSPHPYAPHVQPISLIPPDFFLFPDEAPSL